MNIRLVGLGAAALLWQSFGVSAHALHTLYAFSGGSDGGAPLSLVQDSQGNLFGTTAAGGANGHGTVFKLTPSGTETVIYSFPAGRGGPIGNIAMDSHGNILGVTYDGGDHGYGSVFLVAQDGFERDIIDFDGSSDSGSPRGGVIVDSHDNIYGTTTVGSEDMGTLFEISPGPNGFKQLHVFQGGDGGASPEGALVRDGSGNLYGTTHLGGINQSGIVFELTASGQFKTLHEFDNGDGEAANGLIMDGAGNLFGTTIQGGAGGYGTVFEMKAARTFHLLYSFTGHADGLYPLCTLAMTPVGGVFGTTTQGGAGAAGTLFRVSLIGVLKTVHAFQRSDGSSPAGNLVVDQSHNLYGMTDSGGPANAGTVFQIEE
ncbi:MAG: hypothetical protein JO261_02135 [Alphaproteobacteria bacterium]|nr:hypothetical protein [Alphaproteobacteria bacterium]MBV9692478.1 hypothetical protein [Alphaproteobacteria bacterium]